MTLAATPRYQHNQWTQYKSEHWEDNTFPYISTTNLPLL
jgi:hypothetical protein